MGQVRRVCYNNERGCRCRCPINHIDSRRNPLPSTLSRRAALPIRRPQQHPLLAILLGAVASRLSDAMTATEVVVLVVFVPRWMTLAFVVAVVTLPPPCPPFRPRALG
jgi:hypothetical protein